MSKASKITASELVLSAIFFLQQKNGVTATDITKFICNKRKCKQSHIENEVKKALHRATKKGLFVKKGGLYRIKKGFGSKKMSGKLDRMQTTNNFKNLRPKNTAEEWDSELRQRNPYEGTDLNTVIPESTKRSPFRWGETYQNEFSLLKNKNTYVKGQPRKKFYGCKFQDADDDDEDEDFFEDDDDDDDDDRDFFEDDQFPKPEDALREACRRIPKRKPCKKTIKKRSKSKYKCKPKKRKCPKRHNKSCKRKRPVKCNARKRVRCYGDSSLDEDSDYEDDNYQKSGRKIKSEKLGDYDEDNGDDEDDEEKNEKIEKELANNQSGKNTQSEENENKKKEDNESRDENDDDNDDSNDDEGDEQKIFDNKNQNQTDKTRQSNHKEECQKPLGNNKEGNQRQHEGFGEKEKAINNTNVNNSIDFNANAKESTKKVENGNKTSSVSSAETYPAQENVKKGFSNKPPKRQRSSSLFRSFKKKTSSEEVNASRLKSAKRKKHVCN